MREPLYSLVYENFSRLRTQDEHNASCFYNSAAQIRHKNRRKYTTFFRKQMKRNEFFDIVRGKVVPLQPQ